MRSLSVAFALVIARLSTMWGAIDGPVGDFIPYGGALAALALIIKAMSFLNTYQDRIVNGLDAQLIQARSDIEVMKVGHRNDIDQLRADAAREIQNRDRYIQYLIGQIEDVRKQAGLPERRVPPPPISSFLTDDNTEHPPPA